MLADFKQNQSASVFDNESKWIETAQLELELRHHAKRAFASWRAGGKISTQ